MCKYTLDPTTIVLFEAVSSSGAPNNLLLRGPDPLSLISFKCSLEELPEAVGGIDFVSILSKTIAFSS